MRAAVTLAAILAVAPGPFSGAEGRPGATPSDDGAAGQPGTAFTSTRPGEVVVPVAVGGHGPFRFLLDTGSSHTAVTERLAAAVGAVPVARTSMRAAAGAIECLVVGLPPVAIGAVAAPGVTATVLPPEAGAALGRGLDGVLGQDVLGRFDFTIDYRASRIDWHGPGYAAPGIRLPLEPVGDRWVIELPQPAGRAGPARPAHRFVPDSGADTIVLFDEFRAARLVTSWDIGGGSLGSLTGSQRVRIGVIDGLRVGAATLARQVAAIVPATAAPEVDGLLPLHLFARVFFSAKRRVLVVQPR